ncbi:hypothetical protein HU200_006290 [Digitaria exilis]|uniref:At1g61320/AtMIF1 LRR domain-containing protein n=1 Tax=Digitaria exilis TaxID=1010633 RepID=A0A835KTI3_9POAL|nr:hypothetical protein HU200_006290 [Digitaria exilis]
MLVQDIWCHIHSLLPIQESARAASVSRVFLRSWRSRPNLILTKETLCLKQNTCGEGDTARALAENIDQILKTHSGTGVKTLELDVFDCHVYSFPCSLLFGQNGISIQDFHLTRCAFHPTAGILRNLTNLYLSYVCITGEELGCLLSNSLALMELKLEYCNEIVSLKIPCMLEQLSCLTVSDCSMLQTIESQAPNLTTLDFTGDNLVQLSLGQPLQMKNLLMECLEENLLCYAIANLPYKVPNLETLTLSSDSERVNTPMVPAKFLHLEYLEIIFNGDSSPGYDYLSLLSFLDASPVLETFVLRVSHFFGTTSHLRQMPEHKHDNLKDVSIFGFCSAKSMVELTCHIVECCATSARKTGACWPLTNEVILEAHRGLMAIKTYILGKVPSTVELDVRKPCSHCHALTGHS